MKPGLIYLDNNATTKVDERVLNAMIPYFTENYGNESSTHHFGLKIKNGVTEARNKVADLINASPEEIIFTSGATEGINLVLKSLTAKSYTKKHIITLQTEHKAVLDTCKYLEKTGFDISYLPVDKDGLVDLNDLIATIRTDTLAICAMWVNNETGVINEIEAIGKIAQANKVLFISDATQAVGKVPVDVIRMKVDILIFSAHKFYGPKGVGAVYINKQINSKNDLTTYQHGGGHENNIRSGTLNVPGIIGLGEACSIAQAEMLENGFQIGRLRDLLESKILQTDGISINGNSAHRIYNTSNLCFPNFDANIFIGMNKNIAVSNGSACTAAVFEPSHVLKGMGLSNDKAFASLRISFSKWNTENDVENFIQALKNYGI